VQHARNLVAAGAIGERTRFRGWFLGDYGADPRVALSWRFSRELAGLGVLGGLMSHAADLALVLVGPLEAATAVTRALIPTRPLVPARPRTPFHPLDGRATRPGGT